MSLPLSSCGTFHLPPRLQPEPFDLDVTDAACGCYFCLGVQKFFFGMRMGQCFLGIIFLWIYNRFFFGYQQLVIDFLGGQDSLFPVSFRNESFLSVVALGPSKMSDFSQCSNTKPKMCLKCQMTVKVRICVKRRGLKKCHECQERRGAKQNVPCFSGRFGCLVVLWVGCFVVCVCFPWVLLCCVCVCFPWVVLCVVCSSWVVLCVCVCSAWVVLCVCVLRELCCVCVLRELCCVCVPFCQWCFL